MAGGLLGLLRMCRYHPDRIQQACAGQLAREACAGRLAEAVLRLLGVPAGEAARLTALPLRPAGTW